MRILLAHRPDAVFHLPEHAPRTDLVVTGRPLFSWTYTTGEAEILGRQRTPGEVPHAVCVRVCAPFEVRKQRMMERLGSDNAERIADEIRSNDEAHAAIMRRHFDLRWTDSEHYDVVLNTKRVRVDTTRLPSLRMSLKNTAPATAVPRSQRPSSSRMKA